MGFLGTRLFYGRRTISVRSIVKGPHFLCDCRLKKPRLVQRGFSICFPLIPFYGRLGFRGSIAFDMHKRGYERDLELDLFATQRGSGGKGAI